MDGRSPVALIDWALNWYWTMFAAHADELTWLGVALVVSGLYLRSKVP